MRRAAASDCAAPRLAMAIVYCHLVDVAHRALAVGTRADASGSRRRHRFIKKLPRGFMLVTVALSAMMASRWAHEVVSRGIANVLSNSALVGEQGRLVQRRWIARKPIDDPSLLEAEGIDAGTQRQGPRHLHGRLLLRV